jgi:pimeloyl-ACP methyl ester carboxylesterase
VPCQGWLHRYDDADATGPVTYLGYEGYEQSGRLLSPAVTVTDIPGGDASTTARMLYDTRAMRISVRTTRAVVVSSLAVWLALGVASGTGLAQENGRGRGLGGFSAEWASIAAMAPASFRMNDTRGDVLQKIKDGGVPVIVTHGDADTVVPVTNTQMWIATMKELQLNYQYKEIPGADHGTVIEQGMPDIFAFFKDHAKPAR